MGQWNPPVLHTPPRPNDRAVEPVITARGAGSRFAREHALPILCPPHKIHPRTAPFILPSEGVWGRAPMVKGRP